MLTLGELAAWYARLLGIPSIVCNKCGRWQAAYPGLPFYKAESHFPGLSTIADSDGSIKAQLKGEERVIVANVALDLGAKHARRRKATDGGLTRASGSGTGPG
jgi:predicted amidohydrolase